jgi:ribonuclease R
MLPTALSDHLCSLAPHVDRLCLVADMLVSKSGALKEAKFYPAVMRSQMRLTYGLAYEALFEGRPAARERLGPLYDKLTVLVEVYRALHKARSRRGALDFDAPEAQFVIDEAERVRAIEMRSRNEAHRLIEECMILANVATAEALERAHMPSLYRVHGQPEDEKLERLTSTLAARHRGAHPRPSPAGFAGHRAACRMQPAGLSSRWSYARCPRRSTSRPTSGTSASHSRTSALHLPDPPLPGPSHRTIEP